MTPAGAARSSDIAVLTGSSDYSDGTFQLQGTPVDLRTGLAGGIAFRYRDSADFYGCSVTSTSLQLIRRAPAPTRCCGRPPWGSLRACRAGPRDQPLVPV